EESDQGSARHIDNGISESVSGRYRGDRSCHGPPGKQGPFARAPGLRRAAVLRFRWFTGSSATPSHRPLPWADDYTSKWRLRPRGTPQQRPGDRIRRTSIHLDAHLVRVGHEIWRDVTSVELHPLDDSELGFERLRPPP